MRDRTEAKLAFSPIVVPLGLFGLMAAGYLFFVIAIVAIVGLAIYGAIVGIIAFSKAFPTPAEKNAEAARERGRIQNGF